MSRKLPPTATTAIDSLLFRDAFGTPAMRAVFSDHALIQRYIEIGLAKAEATCGVIPAEAAEVIAARCDFDALDFDLLRRETDNVGYPILPLVHQLVHQCGEAGRYVHWGATTQDIMDTANALQVAPGWRSWKPTSPNSAGSSPTCRAATATHRWPGPLTSSRPCPSPSATRPRSGSRCSTANPTLGYDRVAAITRKAMAEGLSPRAAAGALGYVTGDEYDRIVNPAAMTSSVLPRDR